MLLESSRGLFVDVARYHQGRVGIATNPGYRSQCPNRDLCHNLGQNTLGCNRQSNKWARIRYEELLYSQDPKQELDFDTNGCFCTY